MSSLQDKIKQYVDNAPTRSSGSNYIQYGQLRCSVSVITWQGKGQAPIKTPYKDGMEIESNQSMEIEFAVGVKELNPALEFDEWTRRILVERSGPKIKTDWSEIVLPSLETVFGNDWANVVTGKKVFYVECEQADSINPPRDGKRDYGVPKFLRKFKDFDECKAARDERFGHDEENADEQLGIPEEVINQAKGLLKSLKGNKDKLKKMLEDKPFGNYDADAIIAELE